MTNAKAAQTQIDYGSLIVLTLGRFGILSSGEELPTKENLERC